MIRRLIFATALAAAGIAPALAQNGPPSPQEVTIHARQSLMRLFAFNLGTLGAMAQGKMDYDANAAADAANNLDALAHMELQPLFAPGTGNDANEGTRALPAIWENMDDVQARIAALRGAADAMADAAGGGADALKAAMGPLGGACGACHKAYRAPMK